MEKTPKVFKEQFEKLLINHKKNIVEIGKMSKEELEKEWWFVEKVKDQARELALVNAGFVCEKCKTGDELTIHHLILRKSKEFCDLSRYMTQRIYWANQVCLCAKCHMEFHDVVVKDKGEKIYIMSEYIEKLKKKWRWDEQL